LNRRPILFAAGIVTLVISILAVTMWLAGIAPTLDMPLSVRQGHRLASIGRILIPFLFILPPCGAWLVYRAVRGSRVLIGLSIAITSVPVTWLAGFILFAAGERIWINLALSLTQ
jgi:hypothetical protein